MSWTQDSQRSYLPAGLGSSGDPPVEGGGSGNSLAFPAASATLNFEDDADNAALSRPSDDIYMTNCLIYDVYCSYPFFKCHEYKLVISHTSLCGI